MVQDFRTYVWVVVVGVAAAASPGPCVFVMNGTSFASSHQLEAFALGVDAGVYHAARSPDDWVPTHYDSSVRPSVWRGGASDLAASAEAVDVYVELSAFEIDEKNSNWVARGTLHVSWTDRRLNYTTTGGCGAEAPVWVLSGPTRGRLWDPALAFANAS